MVSIFRRQLRQKSDPSPRRVIATRLCRFFRSSSGLRFPARTFLGLAAAKILPQRPGQALVAVTVFPCFVTFVSPVHNFNYLPGRNPRKGSPLSCVTGGPCGSFRRVRAVRNVARFLLP